MARCSGLGSGLAGFFAWQLAALPIAIWSSKIVNSRLGP